MKNIIEIKYNELEFDKEDIKVIELFIVNQLKESERILGIGFIYKEIIFVIDAIYYNIELNERVYLIKQVTTKKNPIIKTL